MSNQTTPTDRPRFKRRERTSRSDASRCSIPECPKYHDFFQWRAKYYCLECWETLRAAEAAGVA